MPQGIPRGSQIEFGVASWKQTGSAAAKPGTGHSRSKLEGHEQWLLELVRNEPDLTLEEIRHRLIEKRGLKVGIGSVWRFFDRHGISFKKKPDAAEQDRPDVAMGSGPGSASSLACSRPANAPTASATPDTPHVRWHML